jgi:hypothetical protein
LTVERVPRAEPPASGGVSVTSCRFEEGPFAAHVLTTTAHVDDHVVTLEVDSGASRLFLVAESPAAVQLRKGGAGTAREAVGAAGGFEIIDLGERQLTLGGHRFPATVSVMPGRVDERCHYEGRLGMAQLRQCRLRIGQHNALWCVTR